MKLALEVVRAPLTHPFTAAHGTVCERDLVLVRLEEANGAVGHGEAAPLESYDGVGLGAVTAALEACRPALAAAPDGAAVDAVLAGCAEHTVLPPALAAIDLALWDLAGRRAGRPVWQLLGADSPPPVTVNWTLQASDRAGAAAEAAGAVTEGYRTLKAKVAIGDDAGRLAAVRAAAGRETAIRIDANGGWSAAEAEASLRALAPVGIELCEEPVNSVAGVRALAERTLIPLALDESASAPEALGERACALLCLKIARCGGISGLLHQARRARELGYEVFLASTLDGPLGIAAALHAAAVLSPLRACGLATLALFDRGPNPLPVTRGALPVPTGPGLGEGLLAWYGR